MTKLWVTSWARRPLLINSRSNMAGVTLRACKSVSIAPLGPASVSSTLPPRISTTTGMEKVRCLASARMLISLTEPMGTPRNSTGEPICSPLTELGKNMMQR